MYDQKEGKPRAKRGNIIHKGGTNVSRRENDVRQTILGDSILAQPEVTQTNVPEFVLIQ
jgi:hypothetical protein